MVLLKLEYYRTCYNGYANLHSNMVLLKRIHCTMLHLLRHKFTFQYGSIKTFIIQLKQVIHYHLHSNMVLLKRDKEQL